MKFPPQIKSFFRAVKRFATSQYELNDRVSQAAEKNDMAALQKAFDNGGKVAEHGSFSLPKPLSSAIEHGNVEMATLLIEKGAKVNDYLGYEKGTPLTAAAAKGDIAMVTLLLGKGASIESEDNSENTAFMVAVKAGHAALIDFLWDKDAATDKQNKHGRTALFFAAMRGDKKLVEDLLQAGSRTWLYDGDSRSVLDVARAYEKFEVYDLIQKHIDDQVQPWQVTGEKEIAHVTIQRKAGYRLTEVFNFETRNLTTVTHNFSTGRDSTFARTFEEIAAKDAIDLAAAKLAAVQAPKEAKKEEKPAPAPAAPAPKL